MSNESGSKSNRGELAEQILDRIASDTEFRQQLLNNPAETLKQAGYDTDDEVSGYRYGKIGDMSPEVTTIIVPTHIGSGPTPMDAGQVERPDPVGKPPSTH